MVVATTDKPQGISATEIPSANPLSLQAAKNAICQILRNIDWSPLLDFGEVDIYIKKGKYDHIGVRYTML